MNEDTRPARTLIPEYPHQSLLFSSVYLGGFGGECHAETVVDYQRFAELAAFAVDEAVDGRCVFVSYKLLDVLVGQVVAVEVARD